ncbi:hypothetical protein GCM10023311_10680 [Flaviramulus aquimarinus]|uniref:Secretion system C-terminal sorting domain-containing protein n=1 Tax=Flaviramulus aquimarinus TaxID=1170456 RepID=A0ABP9EYE1_9FLAO
MKNRLLLLLTLIPFLAMGQITELVDINSGVEDSSPSDFFVDASSRLFFQADNGTDGNELYVYDGSNATLIDINTAGSSNSNPRYFIEFNNKIYFRASDDANKTELWVTDGTSGNTYLIADINTSGPSSPNHLFVFNGELYFTVLDGPSLQIWALNGETPVKFTTNNSGGFASHSYPHVTATGVYMRVNDGNGNELSFFNGTGNSTEILDIRPGGDAGMLVSSDRENIELLGNKLFFEADSSGSDDELWVSDGTAIGTFQVGFTNPSGSGDPDYFEVHQGDMFFASEDANGYQLWKSDGTVIGTVLVSDMNSGGNGAVKNLFSDGTNLYFSATNGTDGEELWKYDGTTTSMLKDINVSGDSSPSNFMSLNGLVYFSANDGTGVKLWMTDGTNGGTVSVASLFGSGEDPTDVDELIIRDSKLIFSGTGANGNELFSFNPATLSTKANVASIVSVFPNPTSDYIQVSKEVLNFPYTIYNMTGKTVKEGTITSERIDLKLTSGLYVFKVKTELSTVTKKIIIK